MFPNKSPFDEQFIGLPHVVGMFLDIVEDVSFAYGLPHVVGMFLAKAERLWGADSLPHVVGMFLS